MPAYGVLVVGDGTGNSVAAAAVEAGLKAALVEKGPLDGTCVSYQRLKSLACQWDSQVSRSRLESPTPPAF